MANSLKSFSNRELKLNKLRSSLSSKGNVEFIMYNDKSPAFEIRMSNALTDDEFEKLKSKQELIIGKENIIEFYTEETGLHWYILIKQMISHENHLHRCRTDIQYFIEHCVQINH